MKNLEFPLFKSKIEDISQKFDLSTPEQRKKYFEAKAGPEIQRLREFLKDNTFIAYFMGKKGAGKGTYSKLFREAVDSENVEHFSIGDMIREIDNELQDEQKKKELIRFLEKNYRGFTSLEEIMDALESRSTKVLLPTELILALTKREIAKRSRKTLFIDGFPRNLDQISHSLFFRDLIDHREDPDVFVLIDVSEAIIDERIKTRVVCPKCGAPGNQKVHLTEEIEYDEKQQRFYLICENPECERARMIPKEGDELGIENIRERLNLDEELMKKAHSLYGIPKVLLRNHVPIERANEYADDYELTPEYSFEWDAEQKKVIVHEKPFTIIDDGGVESYSLLAPVVVLSMIKQMARIFCQD